MAERLRLAALVIVATALALGGVEAGVRLWLAHRPAAPRDDRPAFFYAPLNAIPVHDYPHATSKPAHVFRILVVGDSFTFPWDLQLDDAFPKRLERMLNLSTPPNGPSAEVLNFGKGGASTLSEIPTLERGLQYDPDLVILQISLNDPPQPQSPLEELVNYLPAPPITAATNPILFHWKTWVLVATRLEAVRSRAALIAYHRRLYDDTTAFRDGLQAMKAACTSHGASFVAVVFPPMQFPVDDRYPFADLHERIASTLADLAIPALDLLSAFRGMDVERLQVRPGTDAHPNEIAHRIAAERIYLWLERRSLIPPDLVVKRKYSQRGLLLHVYSPGPDDGG